MKLDITDTLIVAAAPIAGYLVMLSYEVGYAAHFGYPLPPAA